MTASFPEGIDDQPRKPGRPRKVSTVTKQEYIDDGTAEVERDETFSGLFDETSMRQITRVRVIRKEPNEGTVGYLEDPMLGESEIFERWGGSTYMLQGLDIKGNIKKGATIKIAGDPVFVSKTAEMQWRRSRGLPPIDAAGAPVAAAPALGIQEMLMFIQTQDQQRRQEEREHQEKLRQMEIAAEERRRTLDNEARAAARRDDEERERRRVKDDEERDARRRREQAEAEQRQQQFMQQTIQMLQQSSNQALQFVKATAAETRPDSNNNLMDAVKTVVAIKEAFAGDGGEGGEETVLQTLLKHGGEWISGLSTGIVGAIKEVKGGGVAGQQSRASVPTAPMAVPASPLALLPPAHPLNEKVETLVAKLAAKGLDPIAAMDQIVTSVLGDVDKIPQQGAAKPAASADAPPRPYVQSPVGVAQVTPPPTTTTPVDSPKVIRLSFKR